MVLSVDRSLVGPTALIKFGVERGRSKRILRGRRERICKSRDGEIKGKWERHVGGIGWEDERAKLMRPSLVSHFNSRSGAVTAS